MPPTAPRIAALATLAIFACTAALRADEISQGEPASSAAELFELQVRPVLMGQCFKCHGGDDVKSGLRVDSREALVAGGDRGPALVPGKPQESLLTRALAHDDEELKMPPDGPLPAEARAAIAAWIEQGAVWPAAAAAIAPSDAARHWAFAPIGDPQLGNPQPPTGPEFDSLAPVDRFIRAKLGEKGLTPVGPASRVALLRRAHFDLIGLPPSPEEIERFATDASPQAFERVVDELLASPRYGERWGRHWLDVVRYADTAGDNADYPVPEARLYRDYVIDAFNADKPYDEFVREQLAGDILATEHREDDARFREQTIATGYLALSRRYATAPYELWHLTLEDAIETTGRAFLGLTLRCARCHDHKYDPVKQTDYYALYGIFASTQFPWAGGEEFSSKKTPRQHMVPLGRTAEWQPRAEALRQTLEQLRADIEKADKAEDKERAKELREQIEPCELVEKFGLPPETAGAYAVAEGTAADACVQLRGEPENAGPVVPRGVPAFLAGEHPPTIPPERSGRLELAQWLTAPANPLTARVMVNRIWQWHFGRGLVATPSNFGLRGEAPTHPELLDWLSVQFVESGWSVKSMHRQIMLSETYQAASAGDAANLAHDPDNRYLWRFDRSRLDAESIRDRMLTASGELDLNRPGEHPFPPVKDWKWTQHAPYRAAYPSSHRSVYLMTQRLAGHPYLALFDGPDTNTSTDVRTSATVPAQALFLLNSQFVNERAAALARRLLDCASDPAARVQLACLLCWSRPATSDDLALASAHIERATGELQSAGVTQDQLELEAWTSYARVLLASNEFVYVD